MKFNLFEMRNFFNLEQKEMAELLDITVRSYGHYERSPLHVPRLRGGLMDRKIMKMKNKAIKKIIQRMEDFDITIEELKAKDV